MKDFRELKVWQKAHQLVLKSYKITTSFPKQEMFGFDQPNSQVQFVDPSEHS